MIFFVELYFYFCLEIGTKLLELKINIKYKYYNLPFSETLSYLNQYYRTFLIILFFYWKIRFPKTCIKIFDFFKKKFQKYF